jgi:predicted secreted protein
MIMRINFLILSLFLLLIVCACAAPEAVPPTVNYFYATPASISQGNSCTLYWAVTGADMVTIEPGLGTVPASGSRTVSPSATTLYELTANIGSVATSADTMVTVSTKPETVGMPVINLFESTPNAVVPGGIATLVWDVAGVSSVHIDQSIGDVEMQDRKGVTPYQTTMYTLTAANDSGEVSASTRVMVVNPVTSQMPAELVSPQIALQVTSGKQFNINLDASPATGFQWELDYYDPAYINLVSSEYKLYSVPQQGSTGSQQFTFAAFKVGDTRIKLSYANPEQPVNSASRYYLVRITQ